MYVYIYICVCVRMRGGEGVHIVYDSGLPGGWIYIYIYVCVYCNAMQCIAMQCKCKGKCMDVWMHACMPSYLQYMYYIIGK